METEISKVNNKIWENNIRFNKIKLFINCPEDPSRDRSKWPAIIFAVSRIESVMGRIISLIDSIKTMKGINNLGVPWGVKWVIRSLK